MANVGLSVTMNVPNEVSAAAAASRARLCRVASISAPAGALSSSPTAPPRVRISPMLAGFQVSLLMR